VILDVGSRDGVVVDSTVVAAEGLVGRVVAVGPWTSEVQVLGAAGSTVGVRVGTAGTLGAVGPRSAEAHASRPPGTLSLDLVQPGTPQVGDAVTTLGSVGDRPYVAGVPVGRVVAVDPERGLLTRSATVRPSVDLDALDVVVVVVSVPRAAAREASR
jgi:rod shape-determining protein MreC